MHKNLDLDYEQVVTDANGVMVAGFSALNTNGALHNINMVLNTPDLYTANKDNIISAWDEFLSEIVADTALHPDPNSDDSASSSSESVANSQSANSSESII